MATEERPPIWIYARVSTTQQDTENQLQCCRTEARTRGENLPHEVLEEASTKRHWRERAICGLLQTMQPKSVLIVSEVSRLARSTLECLEIFREAAECQITIVAVKNGLILDGSMQARIVSTVLSMAAEIERDMIRARTKEALARRAAAGLPMGRPKGAKSASKLASKAEKIAELDRANVADAAIARILQVSRGTLARYREQQQEVKS